MENMGGAGQAYAQNIRDYNAPVLDANSEDSLLARQRWAQSNGYQDEANQLGVRLGELGAANKLKAETDDKNARLANMFGNAIPGLPENLQDIARGMRDGLATGDVDYMEAVEFLQNPSGSTASGPTGSWYTAQEYAADHNATNNLKPEDDDYLSTSEAYNITNKNIYGQDPSVLYRNNSAEGQGTADGALISEERAQASENWSQQNSYITNMQQALQYSLKEGANTGMVQNMFPDFNYSTIALKTLGKQLGLDVIAAGNFGQLNEEEMKVAMQVAIPLDMKPADLQKWLRLKISGTQKLQNATMEFMRWQDNNPGQTKADYLVEREWDGTESRQYDNGASDKANTPAVKGPEGEGTEDEDDSDIIDLSGA